MTNKIGITARAQSRNYFEADTVFESEDQAIVGIVNAYDSVSLKAAILAKAAIQRPTDANIMRARVAEAVAQTLECVLRSFRYENGCEDHGGSDSVKLPEILD